MEYHQLFMHSAIAVLVLAVRRSESSRRLSHNPHGASDEVRLVNNLLGKYSSLGTIARPRYNASNVMTVQFGMRLIQMDVYEKEQKLKTSVWIRARWFDDYLKWDPDDYGGISNIVLPWHKVWTPDIVLVNTAETHIEIRHADVMVTAKGGVFWSPHRVFKSACLIDVSNYPYDEHMCHLWFQSMSRYSWQLNIEKYGRSPFDLDTYLASFAETQEWEITQNLTHRFEDSKGQGIMLKFSRRVALRFTLNIKRRLGYTGLLLMLPCVLLGSMSLVVFCLPPERPDRHTLAVSLFGSFLVLTLILVEIAPPTAASVPMLSKYYACNMTLVMLSVFLSGMVVNVSRRGDRRQKVPRFIEFIAVDLLSRPLLLYSRVSYSFNRQPGSSCCKSRSKKKEKLITHTHEFKPFTYGYSGSQLANNTAASSKLPANEYIAKIDDKLNRIEAMLSRGADGTGDISTRSLQMQWKDIGNVMDRLFFVIYVIALTAAFVLTFPKPKV